MSSPTTPIAILSDIHGNRWALDAVLAHIQQRGITQLINLGDAVYGPLDPAGTAERIMEAATLSIMGNQDRVIVHPPAPHPTTGTYPFVAAALMDHHKDWLASLPATAIMGDIFCCHGTPESDITCLLEHVTQHGVQLRPTAEIVSLLEGISQPIIVCGHSHVPRTVWLPTGQLVINPGSVGLPAYEDDHPYPHVMEAGSPHARYAIVSSTAQGCHVEHIAVSYAWAAAVTRARQQGRADWAQWLRSGRA